jgi:two-component system response regulator MprA
MKRIVIVDDSMDMLEGLEALFEPVVKVTRFSNPKEALEFVTQTSEKPDLVVTDCDMPEISGLQLCKGLRNAGFDRPVVMFSAATCISESIIKMAGLNKFIEKPQIMQLKETVMELLEVVV